jgi:hypothetical protein
VHQLVNKRLCYNVMLRKKITIWAVCTFPLFITPLLFYYYVITIAVFVSYIDRHFFILFNTKCLHFSFLLGSLPIGRIYLPHSHKTTIPRTIYRDSMGNHTINMLVKFQITNMPRNRAGIFVLQLTTLE